MNITHRDEQLILFKNYLENHLYKYWRNNFNRKNNEEENYQYKLELIISPTCNNKCSYCYYNNFKEELYPTCFNDSYSIVDNCKKLFNWLKKEKMCPGGVEIFSGEPLNLPYINDIMQIIEDNMPPQFPVVIPTNATFCKSDKLLENAEIFLKRWNNSLHTHFSISIDGKYLDNITRPMQDGTQYDDAFYDRLFTFTKRGIPFHPMIGPLGIEEWKNNLNWYIENIKKYNNCNTREALDKLYLLEVRNPDWTPLKLRYLDEFIDYFSSVAFDAYNYDPLDFYYSFLMGRNSNLYSSVNSVLLRGLGCSIQQNFSVRLGDLKLVPCHRAAYEGYNACNLIIDSKGNVNYKLENPNMYMFIKSFNAAASTKCCDCPINDLCSRYCIGCNFEVNHDFFTPVDNVCALEFSKVFSLCKSLQKIGILDILINDYSNSSKGYDKIHASQLIWVRDNLNNNLNN